MNALLDYLSKIHLSPLSFFLAAYGLNVLPLAGATTGGAMWIFWADPESWNRRGHPLMGWRGVRLFVIDFLVHWVPLTACVIWTLRGRPVEWLLSLGVLAVWAVLWARSPERLADLYQVQDGHSTILSGLFASTVVSVCALFFRVLS